MSRKIILIGGAPTSGKSTVAEAVAQHFKLPWISTDQIREVMRVVAKREDSPKLFTPEGYTAERFLTEFSAEQIADMELEQGEAVWPGIKAFIENDYTWRQGFVVEGVNILPHLVKQDFGHKENVRAVFLVDENADRMRSVVFTRGLWGDAKDYSDDVKEKEVEWATLFSHKLKAQVEESGYPWVEVKKNGGDLQAVLATLGK